MEGARSFKSLVKFQRTTRCGIPEDSAIHSQRSGKPNLTQQAA